MSQKQFPTAPSSYPDMSVDDLRLRCLYIAPPAEFSLPVNWHDDDGGKAFLALEGWFKAHGIDDYDGVIIYLADRDGLALDAAEELYKYYSGNVEIGYN